MALPILNTDLNYIAKMENEPNDVGGLTAEQFKAEFDKAGNAIKTYINTMLLPFLEGADGAANVGLAAIEGLTGILTVQAALERIEEQMAEITQGSVADASITSGKLASSAVIESKLADLAVATAKLANKAVTESKLADYAVNTLQLKELAVTAAKIAAEAIETSKLKNKAVTTQKIGDRAVGTEQIDNLSVIEAKIATGAVATAKLKNEAVTAPKIAAEAVSKNFTATIGTTWTGDAAPYTQEITVTGMLDSDKPIVDLIPSATFATAEQETEAWNLIYKITADSDKITVYAFDKTDIALNIQLKAVRK